MRARTLSHVRLRRLPPLVRPLPSSWLIRFSSTNNKSGSSGSSSGGGVDGKGTAVDGSTSATAVDNGLSASPSGVGDHPEGFDPASMIAPPPPAVEAAATTAAAEPWSMASAAASQFWADFPGSVAPLMGDAGMYVLHGVINTGLHIMGGVQTGVQGMHHLTGLPWWATIGVATVCVKISLLPVVVYQARHTDRMRMAWPEIQMLRDHLAARLDEVGLVRHDVMLFIAAGNATGLLSYSA